LHSAASHFAYVCSRHYYGDVAVSNWELACEKPRFPARPLDTSSLLIASTSQWPKGLGHHDGSAGEWCMSLTESYEPSCGVLV
jgi:hypothetical protein